MGNTFYFILDLKNKVIFEFLFLQCCELLDILGIPYVQSQGEAEAMCAVLNAAGVCIMEVRDFFYPFC